MPSRSTADLEVEKIPPTWTVATWPRGVWPDTPTRARHVLKISMGELIAAGAITRPSREIVVIGVAYLKWLRSKTARVVTWDGVAANRPAHAHKRFGGTPADSAAEA